MPQLTAVSETKKYFH